MTTQKEELNFGKTGAIVSWFILLVVLVFLIYFSVRFQKQPVLFPHLIVIVLLGIVGYLILKPCFLNYFVLKFYPKNQLQIIRPWYRFNWFENAIRDYTIDLKELEVLKIVIPERSYLPANYLFFIKGNHGKAALHLNFDEKEGKLVKSKLKRAKVKMTEHDINSIKYESLLGVSTKY